MFKSIKKLPIITKLLYLLTLIIFIIWVIPSIILYMTNLNNYETRTQALNNVSSKYAITAQTKKFSEANFKEDNKLLFSQVEIKKLDEKSYRIDINMKKENLKSFKKFLETLSLRYYLKVSKPLEFKIKNELITVKIMVETF